jgi:hypothetical protein
MTKPGQPTRFERWLGRSLAFGAHPYAAWRLSPVSVRVALVASYVAAGYLGGFAVLAVVL